MGGGTHTHENKKTSPDTSPPYLLYMLRSIYTPILQDPHRGYYNQVKNTHEKKNADICTETPKNPTALLWFVLYLGTFGEEECTVCIIDRLSLVVEHPRLDRSINNMNNGLFV